jgi:hypothetical protein
MIIVKNPLRRLPVLFFFDGVLAVFLIGVIVAAHREDRLLEEMKRRVDIEAGSNASPAAMVVSAMHVTHELIRDRSVLFRKENGSSGDPFSSSLANQLTGQGACGSYSKCLARLLIYCGYPVRIGQMKVRGQFGGHIFVEARVDDRWVVLDPLYDLAFRRPDSSLAVYADLQKNWPAFSSQTPRGYDPGYRYEEVRYTNWNKIPVLMPVLHWLSGVVLGEQRTANISVRAHLLRVYDLYFYSGLFVFVLLNVYLYRGVRGTLPWQRAALHRMIRKPGAVS